MIYNTGRLGASSDTRRLVASRLLPYNNTAHLAHPSRDYIRSPGVFRRISFDSIAVVLSPTTIISVVTVHAIYFSTAETNVCRFFRV